MTGAAWWTLACAPAGLLIGVAVRAAIWRLAVHDSPRTTCPGCGASGRRGMPPARVSTGRCRACATRTGPAPLLPEFLTGAMFAASAWIAQTEPGTEPARALRTTGLCWLAAFALAAVWIDATVQRLPDRLVIPGGLGAILLCSAAGFCNGSPGVAGRVVLAALLSAALFLLLAVIAEVGLGDLKLAGALAAALGYDSYSTLVFGMAAAFVLAGLVTILRHAAGSARRGARLALGPPLYAGCFLALFLH